MKQYPVNLEDLGNKIDGSIVDRHISLGLVNQPVFSAGAVCQKQGRGLRDFKIYIYISHARA